MMGDAVYSNMVKASVTEVQCWVVSTVVDLEESLVIPSHVKLTDENGMQQRQSRRGAR
jgi:hypothetical protein